MFRHRSHRFKNWSLTNTWLLRLIKLWLGKEVWKLINLVFILSAFLWWLVCLAKQLSSTLLSFNFSFGLLIRDTEEDRRFKRERWICDESSHCLISELLKLIRRVRWRIRLLPVIRVWSSPYKVFIFIIVFRFPLYFLYRLLSYLIDENVFLVVEVDILS